MTKLWLPPEATIYLSVADNITLTAGTVLSTAFASATTVEGVMKDISVTEPRRDAEKIDFLGEDANNYQNAELELKPASMVEIAGTAILPGDEVTETILYGPGTSTDPSGYTTYRSGKTNQSAVAINWNLDDGSDEVNIAGTNLRPSVSDIKITGPDGHVEVTWTLKGLGRDFYGPQFKD